MPAAFSDALSRQTRLLSGSEAEAEALALLRAGEVVALPTETVYGLAADATNGNAVARIFEAKGRPRFNPLIAHVSGLAMAERLAVFDPLSRKLAEHFWPGPLTLVVPAREGAVHPLTLAGLPTIGLRAPRGFAHNLIAALDRPLAMPSANRSGRISPTAASAVLDQLGGRIPLIVDGGEAVVGVESTIVKVEKEGVRLLRPGGIAAAEIEACLGVPVERRNGSTIEAPGMMLSHYAPRAWLRLEAREVAPGEALLRFGPQPVGGEAQARAVFNLSPSGNLREAARNLFAALAELDRSGADVIAVAPIPFVGLGEAINDRLARAAAPRGREDEQSNGAGVA